MLNSATAVERFWHFTDRRGDDECWPWRGRPPGRGAGVIRVGGNRKMVVTRFAHELLVGPVPPDKFVLHTCDFPLCVNPRHFFLGDHAENMADMVAKGRASRRPISPDNRAKLNAALRGVPKSDAHRAALSAAWKPLPRGECPVCGRAIGVNNLSRHVASHGRS